MASTTVGRRARPRHGAAKCSPRATLRANPRCDERDDTCFTDHPGLIEVEQGHFVRCSHAKGRPVASPAVGDDTATDAKEV